MERDAFLARVRQAAGRAILPEVPLEDPGLLVPDLPEMDLVERFVEAVEAVNGAVHTGDPLEELTGIAVRSEAETYLGWDEAEYPITGVGEALADSGVRPVDDRVSEDDRLEHQIAYMDLRLGVTGAMAGFAESGTIVVASGPGRPRMASLIPEIHVALLRRSDIHRSLAHWASGEHHVLADHSNVVFITGPSRTGDIEMRLNIGVHGPREFHVVLV